MAYLRGSTYIWRGGDDNDEFTCFCREVECVEVPQDDVDAFVAMRWAQLGKEGQERATRLAVEKGRGNLGCDPLLEALGMPTTLADLREKAERRKKPDEQR